MFNVGGEEWAGWERGTIGTLSQCSVHREQYSVGRHLQRVVVRVVFSPKAVIEFASRCEKSKI